MKLTFGILAVGVCLTVFVPMSTGQRKTAKNSDSSSSERTRKGLLALYDFAASNGPIVKDLSAAGEPLDLRIANTKAVRRSNGSLDVIGNTVIRTDKPASRMIDAIRRSREITVEAWIRPARQNQSGPARIVTLSKNANERNVTLGQDGDKFDMRLRTTKTSTNGVPSLSSPPRSLTTKLTHIVYARERNGRTQVFVNGRMVAERKIAGDFKNWNGSFRLALGNELSNDRPWLGTFYLVAIYNRALPAQDIERHYLAGAKAHAAEARKRVATSKRLFKTHIEAMLTRHCLECHGWKSKRGRLDLSRKIAALKGGGSGLALVPGRAAESLLWKSVNADEMPKNRKPLSAREKKLLQEWIDTGAVWTVDVINPPPHRLAGSNWLRRLTVVEYIETVRSAVGVDIAKEARKLLPAELRADGFSNTAYNLNVDLKHVEAYGKLAQIIVEKMDIPKFATKYSKNKKLADDNMQKVITDMGRWLLRGPLDKDEVGTYQRIAKAVAKEKGKYHEAVSFIVEAMLQSPRFIYRVEDQVGNGKARPAGNYEIASRLSYILWGGPPDENLLRAADAGELTKRNHVETQVKRMLKDPRAVNRSAQFIREWLNLDRLDNLRPNAKHFPNWNADLAADMRNETLAFFHDVAWKQKRRLSDLLNAQLTYLTPQLAKHYGLKPKGKGMSRYNLSKVPARGGLLTHGSVLTIGGDEASMVARGLFVMHDLLDGHVDDPPPCVDTTPIPTKPGLSQRGAALVRLSNNTCSGCHAKFEPLAFGLEKFDGLGAYHEKDHHGNKLRDDGEILFPGSKKPVAYKTSAQLMNLLAKSNRVQKTINRKITQWALGRPLVETDDAVLARIHEQARKGGDTYESVISAIVLSDLVLLTRTEEK